MDQESYDEIIDGYARKCIALNPEDPTSESMEFANGETTISITDALKWTHSLAEAQSQWDSDNTINQEEYNFHVSIDAIDWDICKQIRVLEKEKA